MTKQERQKSKFVDLLQDYPVVSLVCEKVGVSRATYYRWRDEDISFRNTADEALTKGRESINDLAESVVISGIKDRDYKWTKYWLDHNHKAYAKKPDNIFCPRDKEDQGLSEEQKEKVEKFLSLEKAQYQARIKCQKCKETTCENHSISVILPS